MAFDIDIEDLTAAPDERISLPAPVIARGKSVRRQAEASSRLPGTSALWLKTFGCSHNTSDLEHMHGQLEQYGYRCCKTPCSCRANQLSCLSELLGCVTAAHKVTTEA